MSSEVGGAVIWYRALKWWDQNLGRIELNCQTPSWCHKRTALRGKNAPCTFWGKTAGIAPSWYLPRVNQCQKVSHPHHTFPGALSTYSIIGCLDSSRVGTLSLGVGLRSKFTLWGKRARKGETTKGRLGQLLHPVSPIGICLERCEDCSLENAAADGGGRR